jgi:hypothetical protein
MVTRALDRAEQCCCCLASDSERLSNVPIGCERCSRDLLNILLFSLKIHKDENGSEGEAEESDDDHDDDEVRQMMYSKSEYVNGDENETEAREFVFDDVFLSRP